ncbi:MAG TPA: glycosyltransferase family 39 protein [Planctomycetota bacterium]|nr:glycosyltransferase family 39 protein [Planctomycetota bacterium]
MSSGFRAILPAVHSPEADPGRPERAWLTLGAAILFLTPLQSMTLSNPDEGRIAGIAQEMVLRGDWITPRVADRPYAAYPPLGYWLPAAAGVLLGFHEFAVRLPGALAAVGLVLLVHRIGRRLAGPEAGSAAGLVLCTLPGFVSQAWLCRANVLTALFCSLAVDRALEFRESRRTKDLILLYASLTLGILSKGPVAVIVAALWILGLQGAREGLRPLKELRPVRGLAAAAAAAGLWYAAVLREAGPGFLEENLLLENISAFSTGYQQRRPWSFYLGVLPLTGLPWILFLPLAWAARRGPGVIPSLRAAGFVFAFFMLSSAKRTSYLAFVHPPLAVLLGTVLADRAQRSPRSIRAVLGLLAAALGGTSAALLGVPASWWTDRVDPVRPLFPLVAALAAGAAALLGGAAGRLSLRAGLRATAGLAAAALLAYGLLIAPRADGPGRDLRAFARRVSAAIPPGSPLYDTGPELLDGAIYFYVHRLVSAGRGAPGPYLASAAQRDRLAAAGRRFRVRDSVRDNRGRELLWLEVLE